MSSESDPAALGSMLRQPAAVVVAHPDDEALWLSSVLSFAGRVVFCFADPFGKPKKAERRQRAIAKLPLREVTALGIAESGTKCSVDWTRPQRTAAGIAIMDRAVRTRYEANYSKLVRLLRTALSGFRTVFTHNPWGEYGHADHIQVHRAVTSLQEELGFKVWFSNYVGEASWAFARQIRGQPCWSERVILSPDIRIARQLRKLYRSYGAWTWKIGYQWPALETLYALPAADDPKARHVLAGEVLLDVARRSWWWLPWWPACRSLR